MQNNLHKTIYKEFVYCHPNEHLLTPNNKLTRPHYNSIHGQSKQKNNNHNILPQNIITIQSDITGHYNNIYANNITTPNASPDIGKENSSINNKKEEKHEEPPTVIFDEETFNQIELRGFITKELLKQSLEKGSNLFHIAQEVFDRLCERYNQFKEILHTLNTEFDTTIECIIETGKELTKKIAHIIYELYLAVMNRHL